MFFLKQESKYKIMGKLKWNIPFPKACDSGNKSKLSVKGSAKGIAKSKSLPPPTK